MGGKAAALARRRAWLALACLALAVCGGAPLAADGQPQCEAGGGDARLAVIYDLGGKFDRSFNQAAYDGAERFRRETGSAYLPDMDSHVTCTKKYGFLYTTCSCKASCISVGYTCYALCLTFLSGNKECSNHS